MDQGVQIISSGWRALPLESAFFCIGFILIPKQAAWASVVQKWGRSQELRLRTYQFMKHKGKKISFFLMIPMVAAGKALIGQF